MAPGNDLFVNATNLDESTLPGVLTGQTTFDATKEATEPAFKTNDQSVWYRFIPDVSGWYKFWIQENERTNHNGRGLCLVLGSPTTLAGYTTAAVESLVDNPDSFIPSGDWTVVGYLTAATTYHIKVYANRSSTFNVETSDFTIRWDAVDPPANDDFANAQTLTLPASVAVDTFDNTSEVSEPVISPGFYTAMQSQWFKFVVTTPGWHTARLLRDDIVFTGEAIPDPPSYVPGYMYIQAFNATVDTLAETTEANALAVNSISVNGSGDSTITFECTTAATYYIRVSTPYYAKATGDGIRFCFNNGTCATTMEVEAIAAPANDNFASPETVTTSPIVGTTYGATEEATEETLWGTKDQSVWYEFTPPSDGDYMFSMNEADIVDHSSGMDDQWELYWAVFDAAVVTTLADATYTNMFPTDYNYTSIEVSSGGISTAAIICQGMLAANTYLIKVSSRMSSFFNQRTADFELNWVDVPPPSNDNFANAEAIGSATGNVTGTCLNSTAEASEPVSYYWNTPPQEQGTVWYDWTCPATGQYVFKVESNVPGGAQATQPAFDFAIWQGSTLAGLTKIGRGWAGSENTTGVRDNAPATAIGFAATSGQHYKIQVCNNSPLSAATHKLSWRTNTVTGNTTGAALALPDGRIDNYGNDDTEPPPNVATILSGHDAWWFDDGQVGGVKWFKKVITETEQIEIRGVQFDGSVWNTNSPSVGDIGLICYKGANYASLVVADESGTADDAAMMVVTSIFVPWPISTTVRGTFANLGDTRDYMLVDCSPGDILWIAVFGLYDADPGTGDGTPEDATQFELDMHIPVAIPPNDNWEEVWDDDTYLWNLGKDLYVDEFWVNPEAGKRDGLTLGATAEVGEVARAGFAATRSVWYQWWPRDDQDTRTWEFSIESAVDCVMGIYEVQDGGDTLNLLVSDDDSGTGNTPLINFVPNDHYDDDLGNWGYAIVVDSKTDGAFTLNFRVVPTATPPANDDFADAVVISTIPSNVSGTTIGATAEFDEHTAEEMGEGPKDTVWYKYVATFNGHIKVYATCNTDNDDAYVYVDAWHGTVLDQLERHPDPPPSGPGGGINRGFFSYSDTPAELLAAAITLDVQNGETYYIRVQTEEGGSEDFTIYFDSVELYINIQVSGSEEMHGTLLDDATVLVDISLSSVEDYHDATAEDSATVYYNITSGGTEFPAFQYTDAATVYLNVQIDSHDCHTKFESSQLIGHVYDRFTHTANHRWLGTVAYSRFDVIAGDGLEEC